MRRLAATAFLSMTAFTFLTPEASAWCCGGCYSCYKWTYIQANAFSPFCPAIRPCCCGSCCCGPKICCPTCCVPPVPCCEQPCCPAPCGGGPAGPPPVVNGNGGPALATPPASSGSDSAPPAMPPATNGAPAQTLPMPMPNAQMYPYPPVTINHPRVQPVTYPTGYNPMMGMPYNPMMMGMPYGGGYGGTTYGPAPAYWNPNYRGY